MARICIIGGGVVGLNVAYALCNSHEIFLFEQESFLGHHTSTRNSEVIHAGFPYPAGTLKSRLCIEGNRLTYKLLEELDVPHKKCGKWIIATNNEETAALEKIIENAEVCGAPEIISSTVQKALAAEPAIHNITGSAFSPDSGIMDSAAYIKALEVALSRQENVNLIYPCKVTGINGLLLKSIACDDNQSGQQPGHLQTSRGEIPYDILVNAAGLFADDIYRLAGGQRDFQIIPYRGEYYTWRKGNVKSMIYPVPKKFLEENRNDPTKTSNFGIHAHRAMSGDIFVGPSQIELSPEQKTDYSITTPASEFVQEISHFIRGIKESDLTPAQAGNRPKLFENGRPVPDFQIFRERDIIHLLGIESPGLTAAPAIARMVKEMIF